MKNILVIAVIILLPIFMYYAVNLGKNLSYTFFYEDLVKETIRETIKGEYLK